MEPPLTRCRGQNPGQGHTLGVGGVILGMWMAKGLKVMKLTWQSLPGPHPKGKEGSGLMYHVPLPFPSLSFYFTATALGGSQGLFG